ncbi:hypothetical protein [Falsiroseomonas stagni]|uniref:hypothetical protein n=1 Tax=Falsiroseomonas stagni TaxID=484882 RepID=UPI0011141303|nr:hypothetical protein [Falsiroseomonas stagni]
MIVLTPHPHPGLRYHQVFHWKGGSKLTTKGSNKLNGAVRSSAVMLLEGNKAAAQGGAKTAAAHFSVKIISSLLARVVPIVGAGICAGVNIWFVNGMIDAAKRYYRFKNSVLEG